MNGDAQVPDAQTPDARVILDILDRRGPMSWYQLERTAPLHPDCVDGTIRVQIILEMLQANQLATVEVGAPFEMWNLTPTGREEAEKLRKSRSQHPATVRVALDASKFDRLPTRRLAGRAYFVESDSWLPVGVTLFAPLDASGSGLGLLDFLDAGSPRKLLTKGRELVWRTGGAEIGTTTIVRAAALELPSSQGSTNGTRQTPRHDARSLPKESVCSTLRRTSFALRASSTSMAQCTRVWVCSRQRHSRKIR